MKLKKEHKKHILKRNINLLLDLPVLSKYLNAR